MLFHEGWIHLGEQSVDRREPTKIQYMDASPMLSMNPRADGVPEDAVRSLAVCL